MYAADTSVAVSSMREEHTNHDVALAAVVRHRPVLAGHAFFETFSVLTRLPPSQRIPPAAAAARLAGNFGEPCWLTVNGTQRVHTFLRDGAIAGGAVYDALVAQAALDHGRTLLSADRRAARTYDLVGVRYELIG